MQKIMQKHKNSGVSGLINMNFYVVYAYMQTHVNIQMYAEFHA